MCQTCAGLKYLWESGVWKAMVDSPALAASPLMSATPSRPTASASAAAHKAAAQLDGVGTSVGGGVGGGKLSPAASAGLRRGMLEAVMGLSVTREVST